MPVLFSKENKSKECLNDAETFKGSSKPGMRTIRDSKWPAVFPATQMPVYASMETVVVKNYLEITLERVSLVQKEVVLNTGVREYVSPELGTHYREPSSLEDQRANV